METTTNSTSLESPVAADPFNLFLGACAFFLNGMSLFAILSSKTFPSRQKVTFSSIVLTDTCLGLQIMSVRSFPENYSSDHVVCHVRLYGGIILTFITLFSNVLFTAERLSKLLLPVHIDNKITWRELFVIVVFIWLVSIVLTFALFKDGFAGGPVCHFFVVGSLTGYAAIGITINIAFITIMIMYIIIIKVARRHIRQIAATMVGESCVNVTRVQYQSRADLKTIVTVGIVISCFGISYLPMGAYAIYSAYLVSDPLEFSKNNGGIFKYVIFFFMLNSLMNPIVYIWRLKNCRKELFARIMCRPTPVLDQ